MNWTSRFLLVTSLVLLTGCASAPKPSQPTSSEPQPIEVRDPSPTDGSLQTDEDIYTASCQGEGYNQRCTVTLTMTYTNQTDAAIYLGLCYPDDTSPIYHVDGLTRESAYSAAWACVGHDKAIEVLPGEQRVDVLKISGPNAWDGMTGKPFGLLKGRLQIFYETSSCPGESDLCKLPRETATSNVFTVTLPARLSSARASHKSRALT